MSAKVIPIRGAGPPASTVSMTRGPKGWILRQNLKDVVKVMHLTPVDLEALEQLIAVAKLFEEEGGS